MKPTKEEIELDLKAIGDQRDLDIFRQNHIFATKGHIASEKSAYTDFHKSFLNKIVDYCNFNNIDLVFAKGPCNLYIPLDKSNKYSYCVAFQQVSFPWQISNENTCGRIVANNFIELLNSYTKWRNIQVLSLYYIRKSEHLIGFDAMNLDDIDAGIYC